MKRSLIIPFGMIVSYVVVRYKPAPFSVNISAELALFSSRIIDVPETSHFNKSAWWAFLIHWKLSLGTIIH